MRNLIAFLGGLFVFVLVKRLLEQLADAENGREAALRYAEATYLRSNALEERLQLLEAELGPEERELNA